MKYSYVSFIFCLLFLSLLSSCFSAALGENTKSGKDWMLVWSDEFNETGMIDSNKWTADVGRGPAGSDSWGSASLQYFTDRPENVKVENSNLIITIRKEDYAGYSFTSAQITTKDKCGPFKYGRITARMKLPNGYGMWPGFIMYGTNHQKNVWPNNWPSCGEIDVMEMRGGNQSNCSDSQIMGSIHWKNSTGTSYPGWWSYATGQVSLPAGQKFSDTYHEFEIEWNEQQIVWRLDGNAYFSQNITSPDQTEFQEPYYIEFNTMVGGYFFGNPPPTLSDIENAGTIFPQSMVVDWVRVYQLK